MDWLNIHTSVLDSPEFIRCDPTRRATWLMLLRFCAGQENGGRIAGAASWGDTTWQQMARVRLREVRAESSMWTWDGDDLVVSFYPVDKESEVRAKRDMARTNGQRGGRPKGTNVGTNPGTDSKPTLVNSAKAEGNGKEGNGKEVSAAAPPHAQGTDTGTAAADPLGMESMRPAPQAPLRLNFADWRIQVGHRIFIGQDERAEWEALFAAEGWDSMCAGYAILDRKHPKPAKLFLSMFQEIRK
jgi:hypothetical protein